MNKKSEQNKYVKRIGNRYVSTFSGAGYKENKGKLYGDDPNHYRYVRDKIGSVEHSPSGDPYLKSKRVANKERAAQSRAEALKNKLNNK